MIYMLEGVSKNRISILQFPDADTHSHGHSLWMSNLFVDLANTSQSLLLRPYGYYLSPAAENNQAVIVNILLMWCTFLGGHIEEETFWTAGKSYVMVTSLFISLLNVVCASESLQDILSHLSTRVERAIADGRCVEHLKHLLNFLAAWEQRPAYLTPMTYGWCSAIAEATQNIRPGSPTPPFVRDIPSWGFHIQNHPTEEDGNLQTTRVRPQALTYTEHANLIADTLEVGFRLFGPRHGRPALHLNHTHHHGQVFKTAFLSESDETIADVACIWIADSIGTPPGPVVGYFAERVEDPVPFSPRLRRVAISVIERIWSKPPEASRSEIINLLNRLEVGMEDVVDKNSWVGLLVYEIRSIPGLERLSPHYWQLLDQLELAGGFFWSFRPRDVEVMVSLEQAEDWEKLEVWMAVMWRSLPSDAEQELVEEINRVTLKLLLQWPSALAGFRDLCDGMFWNCNQDQLRKTLDQAPKQLSPLESTQSRYVIPRHVQHIFALIPLLQPNDSLPNAHSLPFGRRRHLLGSEAIRHVYHGPVSEGFELVLRETM